MANDDDFAAIRRIQRACWQTSDEKGWHGPEKLYEEIGWKILAVVPDGIMQKAMEVFAGGERSRGVQVMQRLMLIVTEVAEAAEIYRDKRFKLDRTYFFRDGFEDPIDWEDPGDPTDDRTGVKLEGFGVELADIVIRVFDLAEALGIDLARAIERKMAYNRTREHMHGGKIA